MYYSGVSGRGVGKILGIPVLARKSRCFARKMETLYSVVAVFIDVYNRFGLAKYKYRQCKKTRELPFSVVDFLKQRY